MIAIGAPAIILYLRVVIAYVASESQPPLVHSSSLSWLSNALLALFFPVQLICARYVQSLLRARSSLPASILQYVAVLLLCGLLSVTGAVLLEAFGYNFFLRVRNGGRG